MTSREYPVRCWAKPPALSPALACADGDAGQVRCFFDARGAAVSCTPVKPVGVQHPVELTSESWEASAGSITCRQLAE